MSQSLHFPVMDVTSIHGLPRSSLADLFQPVLTGLTGLAGLVGLQGLARLAGLTGLVGLVGLAWPLLLGSSTSMKMISRGGFRWLVIVNLGPSGGSSSVASGSPVVCTSPGCIGRRYPGNMYVPAHFAVHDMVQIAEFVDQVGAADLVTFDGTTLVSTLLPVIWERSDAGNPAYRPHRAEQTAVAGTCA